MPKCLKCGYESEGRFCPNCGRVLSAVGKTPEGVKTRLWVYSILVVLISLAFVAKHLVIKEAKEAEDYEELSAKLIPPYSRTIPSTPPLLKDISVPVMSGWEFGYDSSNRPDNFEVCYQREGSPKVEIVVRASEKVALAKPPRVELVKASVSAQVSSIKIARETEEKELIQENWIEINGKKAWQGEFFYLSDKPRIPPAPFESVRELYVVIPVSGLGVVFHYSAPPSEFNKFKEDFWFFVKGSKIK